MNNKPTNPQDKAPSISRATRKYERLLKSIPEQQDNVPHSEEEIFDNAVMEAWEKSQSKIATYTSPLKDRIAELEAEIQSFEPLITALEMDNHRLRIRS